jgi:hypothetical protein
MSNIFLTTALHYRDIGLSVIPVKFRDKKPIIPWQEFQKRIASTEEINEWWRKYPSANVGIVTGKVSGIFVVDLDKYAPDYSEEVFNKYFPENIICPTASTARGGQHLYFSYPENSNISIGARNVDGIDFRGEGGFVVAPPSIGENGKPYLWVVQFDRATLVPPPEAYINKASTLYKGNGDNNHNCRQMSSLSSSVFVSGRRDQDLFHLANCLVKGGCETEFIKQVMNIAALSCNPPFPENEVNTKIESAIKRAERKERNLAYEINEWILSSSGRFLSSDVAKCLLLSSREDQKNLSKILKRLCEEGIIRKAGDRNGCFEIIQKIEENIIDLASADNSCLPIKFPLGVHELVKIMPKNIIIVAGEGNSGKTAFLLNIAARNMIDHKVFYFSSEMGGAELKERVLNFTDKMPYDFWIKHCTFIEQSSDFDITIRPNDINIIDFLEIHDEFYKIGGYIKKIFDKLDKGIAIIAIQKNVGRDEGLGGARSLEKARLYLAMRPGVIKIVKAKNWVSGLINPNGLEKQYKLAKGMIFTEQSNWVHSDEK